MARVMLHRELSLGANYAAQTVIRLDGLNLTLPVCWPTLKYDGYLDELLNSNCKITNILSQLSNY